MEFTQVTSVKGRYASVRANIKKWLRTDVSQLVLVDYGCPEKTGERIAKEFKDIPQLDVICLDDEVAGPFYSHGRARNIGAQAAKYEHIFFIDSDVFVSDILLENIEEAIEAEAPDIITFSSIAESISHKSLPITWTTDGQLLIKNSAFFMLNGFDEDATLWGAETYDLILRAKAMELTVKRIAASGLVQHIPHGDDLRDKFLSERFSERGGREKTFQASMEALESRHSSSLRAQPGRRFGLPGPTLSARLYRSGTPLVFKPGEI